MSVDPGSILWRAFLFPPLLFFFLSLFQLDFKSWHGFNPYQIPIFFLPITLFLFPLLHFCFLFCPPLISYSPFPLPSFIFFFLLFFSHSFCFFFFFLFPFFFFFPFLLHFFPSFLPFIVLISSSFPPPLSFSLFLFFSFSPLNFFLVSPLYQGGCYETKV